MRALGLGSGHYRAVPRPEALRANEGQGGGSAQGLNRMGAGMGGGSGQFESIEGPRRSSGRCSGGQTEMGVDLGNDGRMVYGGDDLQGAKPLPIPPVLSRWKRTRQRNYRSRPRLLLPDSCGGSSASGWTYHRMIRWFPVLSVPIYSLLIPQRSLQPIVAFLRFARGRKS
jgi:hypothetical protein